jgi:hypothetical protein
MPRPDKDKRLNLGLVRALTNFLHQVGRRDLLTLKSSAKSTQKEEKLK